MANFNVSLKKLTEKVLLPQSRKYGFLLYTLSHTHHLICIPNSRSLY